MDAESRIRCLDGRNECYRGIEYKDSYETALHDGTLFDVWTTSLGMPKKDFSYDRVVQLTGTPPPPSLFTRNRFIRTWNIH
jgi:hypothetical protein